MLPGTTFTPESVNLVDHNQSFPRRFYKFKPLVSCYLKWKPKIRHLPKVPKCFYLIETIGIGRRKWKKSFESFSVSTCNIHCPSLLQAICANVEGVTVQNFSSSFADGQVLCHLISNFLPQCLPRDAIKIPETSASAVSISSLRLCQYFVWTFSWFKLVVF